LTNGTTYEVEVIAVNAAGPGAPSTILSATPATTPSAPRTPVAVGGSSSATVSFAAPSSDGGSPIVTYLVETSINNGLTWSLQASVPKPQTVLIPGLQGGDTYLAEVIAVNAVGQGTPALSQSFTVTSVPSAPLNVTVANGDTTSTISWSDPAFTGGSAISGFELKVSTDGGASFAPPIELSPVTHSYTLTGLNDSQTYWVTIDAVNGVGAGTPSALSLVTPVPALSAPTNLSALAGDASATVSWTAPALTTTLPISGYVVEVCASSNPCGPSDTWTIEAATAPDIAVNHVLTGLVNGTAYSVRVAVVVAGNIGPFSSPTVVTPSAAPSEPVSLAITPGDRQLLSTWNAPLNDGGLTVSGYSLEISPDGGGVWDTATLSGTALSGVNALSTSIDGYLVNGVVTPLVNGVSYLVRVNATNTTGTGAWSPGVVATPAVLPGAPTGPQAVGGPLSVLLSWTAPTDTGGFPISHWRITWTEAGGSNQTGSLTTSNAAPDASITGIETYLYTFSIAAITQAGIGPAAMITGTPLPDGPISPTATAGDTTVTLHWTTPSGLSGEHFVIESSNDGGATWSAVTNPVLQSSTGTSWTNASGAVVSGASTYAQVTGLTNGTPEILQVVTVTAGGGQSLPSAAVVAVPAGAPLAPTNLTLVPGDGQIVASWTPANPNGSPITNYTVSLSTNGGQSWIVAATTTLASVVLSGLIDGQDYVVSVVAANNALGGSLSTPATATTTPITVPGDPTAIVATSTANGQGENISWTAPANTGGAGVVLSGYVVSYSSDGGVTWSNAVTSSATTAVLANLSQGVSYLVRVAAMNTAGTGPWSSAVAFVPQAPAGAPTGLSATPEDGAALLRWSAPTNTGGAPITGYEIDSCLGAASSCNSWTVAVADTGVPTTTWMVGSLINGNVISFRVIALTAAGPGAASATTQTIPSGIPNAPTNVTATPGSTQITLHWVAPTDNGLPVTSYLVSYTSDGGATWQSQSVSAASTSYTATGLTNGVTYAFRVSAVNGQGSGLASSLVSSSPWTVPSAPQTPTATPADSAVVLTWTAPASDGGASVSGYLIDELVSGTWTRVATTTGTARSTTITSLTNGTTYSFRVSAENAAGSGSPTATITATPSGLPTTATGLSATPGDQRVILNWIVPSNDGGVNLTGYVVQVSTDGGALWSNSITVTCSLTPASQCNTALSQYTVSALTGGGQLVDGTAYSFRIAAQNAAGPSPWSDAVTATPAGPPPAPHSLSVTGIDPGARMTWTAPATTGGAPILGYIVSWKIHGSTNQPSSIATPTIATTYVVNGLEAGVTYDFTVAAVTSAGVGATSIPVQAVPFDVPSAPQSVSAVSSNASAVLNWTAPSTDNGSSVTGYEITESTDGAVWNVVVRVTGVTTYTTTISGLTNGTTYSFRVAAVNTAGPGAPTGVVAVTPATTPSAPGKPTVSVTNSLLSLSWSAPTSNGGSPISSYQVWLSANGATATLAATTSVPNAVISGLTTGVTYTATVIAVNAAGPSAPSPATTATTAITSVPSAPLNLAASVTSTAVSLSWQQPSSTGGASISGYKVYSSSDGGQTWILATTTSTTSTTLSSLTVGTTYSFEVFAQNSSGSGAGSNVAAATINAAPLAPIGISISAGAESLVVSWSAAANPVGGVVTGYKVEYSTNGTTWVVAAADNPATSITIGSLTPGVTYQVRISTVASTATSAPSTPSSGTPIATPTAPQSLVATAANASVNLTWSVPSSLANTVTSYAVSWCQSNCSSQNAVWTLGATVTMPGTLAATISGLVNGVTYSFSVTATNAAGSSPAVVATATPAGPSSAPQIASVVGGNLSLSVTWTAPTSTNGASVSSYALLVQDPSSGLWVTALGNTGALSAASSLSAVVTGYGTTHVLTPGQQYAIEVVANSVVGQSPASVSVSASPFGTPSAPASLSGTVANRSVTLTWAPPTSTGGIVLSGYRILSVSGSTSTVLVANTNSLSTTWTLSNLTNGTSVTYEVEALNAAGASSPSTTVTLTPAGPPGAVTGVTASSSSTTVSLNWAAAPSNGSSIVSYAVLESTDGGVTYSTAQGAGGSLNAVGATNATVTGLTPGNTYLFVVSATNGIGVGAPSAPISVTVAITLTSPTNLRAVSGDTVVGLAWKAPTEPDTATLTGYLIEQSTDGSTWTTVVASTNSTATSYQVTDLTDGMVYQFRVSAVTTAGASAASNVASAVPLGLPSAPTNLTASTVSTGVRLSWTAPTITGGAPVSAYRIQTSADGTTWTTAVFSTATPGTTLTLSVSGSSTIYYRVAALNIVGLSPWSTSASCTPPAPPLNAPTNLVASTSGTTATLTWVATSGSTSTTIQESVDGGVTWNPVLTTTASTATFANLTLGVGYAFRVVANKAATQSAPSAPVVVTPSTPPAAPQRISVTTGNGSVKISWSAPAVTNGASVTGYVIQIAKPGGSFTTVAQPFATALSAVLRNLVNGTTYLIRIAAVNGAGTGTYSASFTVKPIASGPTL
jgi:titin